MVENISGICIECVKEGDRDIIVVTACNGKTIFTCQKTFWEHMADSEVEKKEQAVLRDALLSRAMRLYG